MAVLNKNFPSSRVLTAVYTGFGDGDIRYTSGVNDGIDECVGIAVGGVPPVRNVSVCQRGMREEYTSSDGFAPSDMILAVLKT